MIKIPFLFKIYHRGHSQIKGAIFDNYESDHLQFFRKSFFLTKKLQSLQKQIFPFKKDVLTSIGAIMVKYLILIFKTKKLQNLQKYLNF